MSRQKDIFVSLAVVFNSPISRETIAEYDTFLSIQYANYEILLVDYGCNDSFASSMSGVLAEISKIRYIKLAGKVWLETALAAGMENAIGDIIVVGTPETVNVESLEAMIDRCCSGYDVVAGHSGIRKSGLYRLGSKAFDILFGKLIGYHPQKDDTGLRIISRRAANAVMATPRFEYNLFVRLSNCGYACTSEPYVIKAAFKKDTPLLSSVARAISILVYNSTTPLRIINALGIVASLISLLISFYSIVIRLFKNDVVEGWTTMTLFMSIQFFFLFIIISFIGEYLARLLTDRSETAAYSVMFEKHSSVMLDTAKLNIREKSESDQIINVQTGRDR